MTNTILSEWKAIFSENKWQIKNKQGKTIATIINTDNDESYAKLISLTPYISDALKSVVELMGDEDIPDNGELSGAAISDMARSAVSLINNIRLK